MTMPHRIAVTLSKPSDLERLVAIVQTYGRHFKTSPQRAADWLTLALSENDTERELREHLLRLSKPWDVALVVTSYHA